MRWKDSKTSMPIYGQIPTGLWRPLTRIQLWGVRSFFSLWWTFQQFTIMVALPLACERIFKLALSDLKFQRYFKVTHLSLGNSYTGCLDLLASKYNAWPLKAAVGRSFMNRTHSVIKNRTISKIVKIMRTSFHYLFQPPVIHVIESEYRTAG